MRKPIDKRLESARLDAIERLSAFATTLYEAGILERSQMLGNGGLGD